MELANKILNGHKPSSASKEKVSQILAKKAAIHQYFQRIPISDYECSACAHTNAKSTKQSQNNEPPLLLRIQLKRFVTASADERVTNLIEPPLQIDLRECCVPEMVSANSCAYRLVAAAIHHLGNTADTGHYTAIGCTPSGDDMDFYLFDDGMPPLPIGNDLIQRYLAENGYFYISELVKTAKKDTATPPAPVPAAEQVKRAF